MLHKIFIKIVPRFNKKVSPVNSELLVDLKNIESPQAGVWVTEVLISKDSRHHDNVGCLI